MQILQDRESKEEHWQSGYEMYYSKGVTDPDYSVLKFTAETANLYSNLCNETIEL